MQDLTNKRIGRYEIQERIGKGGMGEVYKAIDTQLNRFVALKILLEKYIDDEASVKRFEREALAASALNHPHILTVYDIGNVEGKTFIATEFVEGHTLRKKMQNGLRDLNDILAIAVQIGDALMAAHNAAIVHRDIKPDNIMLRNDGYVKVLDFGLAKLMGDQSNSASNTLPGVILGTPLYMSPEQARGHPVDARTDIWSFGVILYEMLTGVCPFSGSTVNEIIDNVLTIEAPPISVYRSDISQYFEAVIKRAMSKNLIDRYSHVSQVVFDLKQIPQLPIVAHPAANYATVKNSVSKISDNPKIITPSKRRSRKAIKSVAILPLNNQTNDAKVDYLSDGITETIINNLSHLPQLKVMSRSSVFRFKGKEIAATEVGQELSVGAVLTGKLLRVGTRFVVQTELVDVADGSQICGFRYDFKKVNVFEIQDKIAAEITESLKLKITGPQRRRLKKRYTISEQAYFIYLKGRFHWNKRSAESVRKAINYFHQAIEEDPIFALAFCGLADSYVVLGNQHAIPAREAFPKAKAAAIKALEIDDSLAEAYANLGYVKATLDRDWSGSLKAFERAIALNPGYATAHQWYSVILIALGRFDESLAESFKALELDPLSRVFNSSVGQSLYFGRRYGEAIEQYKRMLSIDDDFHWTHYFLGCAYRQQNLYEEAIAEFKLALKLINQEPVIISDLSYTYGLLGKKHEAASLLKKLQRLSSSVHVTPYDLAVAHIAVEDWNAALDLLEESDQAHDDGVLIFKIDPVLDPLRDYPRFQAILDRNGLS